MELEILYKTIPWEVAIEQGNDTFHVFSVCGRACGESLARAILVGASSLNDDGKPRRHPRSASFHRSSDHHVV